jgi:hypothetical protein
MQFQTLKSCDLNPNHTNQTSLNPKPYLLTCTPREPHTCHDKCQQDACNDASCTGGCHINAGVHTYECGRGNNKKRCRQELASVLVAMSRAHEIPNNRGSCCCQAVQHTVVHQRAQVGQQRTCVCVWLKERESVVARDSVCVYVCMRVCVSVFGGGGGGAYLCARGTLYIQRECS